MPRRQRMYTIYDVMEEKGVFEANPANVNSRDAEGLNAYKKANYPKMLYHPLGEEIETSPGEWAETPRGPVLLGQQFALINQTVNGPGEEKKLRDLGWHEHPAKAIKARVDAGGKGVVPPMSPELKVGELEDELEAMRERMAELEAKLQAKAEGEGEAAQPASISPLSALLRKDNPLVPQTTEDRL